MQSSCIAVKLHRSHRQGQQERTADSGSGGLQHDHTGTDSKAGRVFLFQRGRYLAAGQDQALSDKNYEKRQADSGGRQREREKSL